MNSESSSFCDYDMKGENFTKKELQRRLGEMGVPYDNNETSKVYYVNKYDTAMKERAQRFRDNSSRDSEKPYSYGGIKVSEIKLKRRNHHPRVQMKKDTFGGKNSSKILACFFGGLFVYGGYKVIKKSSISREGIEKVIPLSFSKVSRFNFNWSALENVSKFFSSFLEGKNCYSLLIILIGLALIFIVIKIFLRKKKNN